MASSLIPSTSTEAFVIEIGIADAFEMTASNQYIASASNSTGMSFASETLMRGLYRIISIKARHMDKAKLSRLIVIENLSETEIPSDILTESEIGIIIHLRYNRKRF